MGNSSGKETAGGGGGNTNNKPTDESVLTFDVNSPNNTNLFVIYNNISLEYIIKIIKSLHVLPVTNSYTLFFPGFQVAPTINKTKFSTYILDIETTQTSTDAQAAIDKIDTDNLKATVTRNKNKCTVFSQLPSFNFDAKTNKISCSRNVYDTNAPTINIFINDQPAKGSGNENDIVDCYIDNWSSFDLKEKSRDAIGKFHNSRLFKEDPETNSMYSFVLESFNVNKMYKDNRFYFILPNIPNVETMLRHMQTVGVLKNTCTVYMPQYYSGQLKNVVDTFLPYFNFPAVQFYTKSAKVICLNSDSNTKNTITFKQSTLDLINGPTSKSMFYIDNKRILPTSKLYGLTWTTNYSLNDPPTEIFATVDDIKVSPNVSFIYYHLTCGNDDYYMVPQIINNAKKRLSTNSSYKGLEEKFTLTFTHDNYDKDTIFSSTVDSIPFLKIVNLEKANMYVLTNIMDNQQSILSNYYFTVSIADPKATKYTNTVAIDPNGTLQSLVTSENSRTNLINLNPITSTQGSYFSKQYVYVPDNIKNNKVNTYILFMNNPQEATLWNFCRQCHYNNTWQNFIIITNFKVAQNTIIPDFMSTVVANNYYSIWPSSGYNFKNITSMSTFFKMELDDYMLMIGCGAYSDNIVDNEEHIAVAFNITKPPWMALKDTTIGYQHRQNPFNIHMIIPEIVGVPVGTISCVTRLKYTTSIDIIDRKLTIGRLLYYIVLPKVSKDLIEQVLLFAEKEFELNSKTSKFNMIIRPEDPNDDMSALVKIGKIDKNTKFIYYLYDKTSLSNDKDFTLITDEYSKFQCIPDLKDLLPEDDMLALPAKDNPIVVNDIASPLSKLYTVLRTDISTSPTTILSLQMKNQMQFVCDPYTDSTIVNSKSSYNNLGSFDITKTGLLVVSVVRLDFVSVSQFLLILIARNDLAQKRDEFVILISFEEDSYIEYYNMYEILKKTVPCDVYRNEKQKLFILTNTPINLSDDSINTRTEKIMFVTEKDPQASDQNYIINRKKIKGRSIQFTNRESNIPVNGTFRQFEQLIITAALNDFVIEPNKINSEYPVVNFMFIPNADASELNYIADTFKTLRLKENLVIVSFNNVDYSTMPNIASRKHLAVIGPPHFQLADIKWSPDLYYIVTIPDNKSNQQRQIRFIYMRPDCQLAENGIRPLVDEISFVAHYKKNASIGVEYSNELDVLCNDTSEITYNVYNFNNLDKKFAPQLHKWVSSSNRSISYLRPIDREILDGGSYISKKYVILAVCVSGDLNDYELMNLIVHIYTAAAKCCAAVIFNNSAPPKLLNKMLYDGKHFNIDSSDFVAFEYNYIYSKAIKIAQSASDKRLVKIINDISYYDDVTNPNDKLLSVDPANKYLITNSGARFTSATFNNRKYGRVKYDLTVFTTDVDV